MPQIIFKLYPRRADNLGMQTMSRQTLRIESARRVLLALAERKADRRAEVILTGADASDIAVATFIARSF